LRICVFTNSIRVPRFQDKMLENRYVKIGLIILGLIAFGGIIESLLPTAEKLYPPFLSPSTLHFFGTDDLGHDVLRDVLTGSQTSLLVGLIVGLVSALVGVLAGAIAGYSEFWDKILMRIVDLFLVIPRLPLLIFLAILLKPSFWNVVIILSLFGWTSTARSVRPLVKGFKKMEFVLAAKSVGCNDLQILIRHILPHLYSIFAVQFVIEARQAVLAEAGLGFLGLEDPTTKSWGIMLSHAFNHDATFTTDAWMWTVLPPTFFLMAFTLALSLLAVGLETVFNPKLRMIKEV